MAVADIEIGVGPTLAARFRQRMRAWGLFTLLGLFTLTTFDGGDVAARIVSAVLLLAAAFYFVRFPGRSKFKLAVDPLCLLCMTVWGILQTLFFPHKFLVNGSSGVLFWFTAAIIGWVGVSVFERPEVADEFRTAFIYFASAVCLLDLVEQASGTNRFFGLIPSRYSMVFGTFAYWNNFAQFVELALPITLWHGLAEARPNIVYLLLSALQVCAVIASGSRAGSALVILELIVVLIAAYLRRRKPNFLFGAAVAVVLTMAFVYSAGYSTVISKLQESDQLNVRRHINQSSMAMLAEHPIAGWGLETYVPVYRMFALYDDGTYVNRAHNDWLQFAVEGGIPFACLFGVMVVWSIGPALRSGWGIGVMAIALHAVVDYPFARFGVCGWYFALVAMLACQEADLPLERDELVEESSF